MMRSAALAPATLVAALAPALVAGLLAGCGSGGTAGTPGPAGTSGAPASTTRPAGGSAVAYDCATLLSPAELDAAAGLEGGIVTSTSEGSATSCAIEIPGAGTWFGHFSVYSSSSALASFDAAWDFAVDQGATALPGVGTEALIQSDDMGVNGWARDGDGAGVDVGVAWDEDATTEDAVREAVREILVTLLART